MENSKPILEGDFLKQYEKEELLEILRGKASFETYLNGLSTLSEYLYRYHNQKVVILIDEYDVPIQSGYINGYYDEVIELMRIFLSGGLKDNTYLEKAVLTGILRVAKESIFSGLNNLDVSTILGYEYNDYFGFLDEEVEELLNYYNKQYEIEDVKRWYNGYRFGDRVIYNPWSILNFAKNIKNEFKPYWVNTSSNDLVKRLLAKGSAVLKKELEELIEGKTIEKEIFENTVMGEIDNDSNTVWNFLLFTGYLKVVDKTLKEGVQYCKLAIPNMEIRYLYRQIVLGWFSESVTREKFELMLKSLVSGDIELFEYLFNDFVMKSISYFDVSGEESEKVYHSFVLGILVALSDRGIKDIIELGIAFEGKKVLIEKANNNDIIGTF